jgi:hypothetical protein
MLRSMSKFLFYFCLYFNTSMYITSSFGEEQNQVGYDSREVDLKISCQSHEQNIELENTITPISSLIEVTLPCSQLGEGADYERCRVYRDGLGCNKLKGSPDFEKCRVYKDRLSCSLLKGKDYDICKVYKDDLSCARFKGPDYDKCRVYKHGNSCSRLKGNDYKKCKVYKDGLSCSNLKGTQDYDKCRVYRDSRKIKSNLALMFELVL